MTDASPTSSNTGRQQVVAATRTISALTLVSRIAGLARDAVNSRVFGASPEFSAFTIAFLIPNLFRRLFGEGALSAAFLPRYARLIDQDPAQAVFYARTLLRRITAVLVAIVIIVEIVLGILWSQWHTNSDLASRTLAIELTMLMFPFMPMVCLTALLGAVLQVQNKFAPTAGSPIVLNLCIIAPALWAYKHAADAAGRANGLYAIAVGVLIAGLIQIIWSISALQRRAFSADTLTNDTRKAARTQTVDTFRFALPMILGLGVLQLNTFLDGLIASYPILVGPELLSLTYPLDGRSAAILGFAQRLYQFPLGVFGIAVATAIYPALARTAGDSLQFTDTLRHGVRLSLFIALPATIGLVIVSDSLTAVVFQGGAFAPTDVVRVAAVLMAYAPAVAAYSVIHLFTRAFYSLSDSRTPVRVAMAMCALNLVLNLTFIWFVGEKGLALSTSICAWLQVWMLGRALSGSARLPDLWNGLPGALGRLGLATIIMGILTGALALAWRTDPLNTPWSTAAIRLALLFITGAVTYLFAARILNLEELHWLLKRHK